MDGGQKLEWDEAKRQSNIAIHGLDFKDANKLDWSKALTVDQPHASETRHATYAPLGNRLCVFIWTGRNRAIRVISFRKANLERKECL